MTTTTPKPHHRDIRICFAIAYFTTEDDAGAFARATPGTYNGGYSHGMPTGRDRSWDYTGDDGVQYFATTY